MTPKLAVLERGARLVGLLRPAAAPQPRLRRPRPDQGLAAARHLLRVLRRLRRLRRDRLRQAAEPALRRPPGRGQRHRLLLDLRRQPAHHPVGAGRRRPRPRLVELALRGRGRVRLRHAAGGRRARFASRGSCWRSCARPSARPWRTRSCWARAGTTPPSPPSAQRVEKLRAELKRVREDEKTEVRRPRRRRSGSPPSPRRWCPARCG
jgi:hypothetical protein